MEIPKTRTTKENDNQVDTVIPKVIADLQVGSFVWVARGNLTHHNSIFRAKQDKLVDVLRRIVDLIRFTKRNVMVLVSNVEDMVGFAHFHVEYDKGEVPWRG